jgi:hypothetical protein
MKRFNRDTYGGVIADALGTLFYIAFILLTIWGIAWSFYRHGPIHGTVAFTVWPYAWYRGVAAIWDKPEWKEDYDVRTEQLALVIENAVNNDPTYQIQSRDYIKGLKEWIKTLPPGERDRVREASRNYALALGAYIQRFFSELMEGNDNPQPGLDATVQQRVEKFKPIAGFANRWQRFVQDSTPALKDLAKDDSDNGLRNMSSLTVGDRAIVENRMHTSLDTMAAKMESVIDELFSTK